LRKETPFDSKKMQNKLYQRIGWQPRCKPTVLPSGRIVLPLYSDTFSLSIMAISDDDGETWYASKPLLGFGAIQPTVLRRDNGELVALHAREWRAATHPHEHFERRRIDLGPRHHDRSPQSRLGTRWRAPRQRPLVARLQRHNHGRNSLAVSISDDEGKTWKWKRHLEKEATGSYHYPSVIQARDGTIHVVYSYFVKGGKSMKHAAFNEAWVQAE
jgi:hypothetical protein